MGGAHRECPGTKSWGHRRLSFSRRTPAGPAENHGAGFLCSIARERGVTARQFSLRERSAGYGITPGPESFDVPIDALSVFMRDQPMLV
mgnify:CR=1 FL=1